ncbi:CDP-alcohol phosphatidyltransferase family protein [Undibacterium squillarum]|uniref:Membrane protein n=1 Tax=Undibacterium squillarum TaxID=1131567 RepID=A0ABQ2XTA2_9BURK|nr:CDP-alcohol phosphatidyltransferase family protein [Undibacterium squillarum]GGX33175.1 membrane protein [Undibacterium squillarum]
MKISVYQLKPAFQRSLQPLLQWLLRSGVHPNHITLGALAICIIYGAALICWPAQKALWIIYPLMMLLRMMLNALDGMLANAAQLRTRLGALLNELCDVLADIAVYLPLVWLLPEHAISLLILLALGMLTEFTGVLAVSVQAARAFDGPMGKSDRAVLFSVLVLLQLAGVSTQVLLWLQILGIALATLTVANRFRSALRAQQTPPDSH